MHSVQTSKARHNIFARVDHDQNFVKAHISPKKTTPVKNEPEEKGLAVSSSLPSIDFQVRKKLAAGDLAAKFQSKTQVLNVSSTLGIDNGQMDFKSSRREGQNGETVFDYNDEEDNESIRSDSSEPSIRLENFKRNLADSPQHAAADSVTDGFFEAGFDDDIVEEASFSDGNNAPDYVSISKQDAKQFLSPLDAHKKYVKAVRSKNHLSSMKSIAGKKLIPTASQKSLGNNSATGRMLSSSRSTASGMSQNDDASVMSEVSASSSSVGTNRFLGTKKSSFLFLSSFISVAPTIQEEKGEEEEEEDGQETFVPFNSSKGINGNPLSSPSAKAPLESTSSPVMPKVLRMRSFSRFNPAAEENDRLMLRMLDSQKSVQSMSSPTPQQQQQGQYPGGIGEENTIRGLQPQSTSPTNFLPVSLTNVLSPILSATIGAANTSSPQSNSPAAQNDPKKKSLYEVAALHEVRNKKKNFTDWIDDKIRALTFVPAPEKVPTPPPEEVPPLTVESLFGESLMHTDIDKKALPMSNETYQRILREAHEKQKNLVEEQYRQHNLLGNEGDLIKELERDYHYREQQRIIEQQKQQQQQLEATVTQSSHPVNTDEIYSSTYMEPLGIPPRKSHRQPSTSTPSSSFHSPLASSKKSDHSQSFNAAPAVAAEPSSLQKKASSGNALLPKLDLTPVLQKQQQQQQAKKDLLPRSETFLAASSFDLLAGDDNGSVLSFSSSITSLPGVAHTSTDPHRPNNNRNNKDIGTRLPMIHQEGSNLPKSLFQHSPPASIGTKKYDNLPEEQDRIVYHDPFSTMFAYTSDDIKHYSAALHHDTQEQLQRLYDADPSQPKHSSHPQNTSSHMLSKSIFDIDDDLAQPLEATSPDKEPPRFQYQHSTTSYVLQDWENYAARGIPNELPSFAADPQIMMQQDHDRMEEAKASSHSHSKPKDSKSPNKSIMASKSPTKKRELDALDVISATRLNRKITLEDIDTSYQSLRHQSQIMTYSTVMQQELANDADAKRIYSIMNPGPHEAVIFLPPDHAQFAAEMRETYHSLPAGLLAYTQDKDLMQSVERQSQQVNAHEHNAAENYADTLSARKARLQPLLGGSRIISLSQDANQPDYDAYRTQEMHQQQQANPYHIAGQADYAQEFVSTTSNLLSSPGVVYSQDNFNQVRQQLNPVHGGGQQQIGDGHLPSSASQYAMSLRQPGAQQGSHDAYHSTNTTTTLQKTPSMATEYAQYLAQQQQQRQLSPNQFNHPHQSASKMKPPLHPTAHNNHHNNIAHNRHNASQQSVLSVAGFNDDFFRAIPVVEESGLDDNNSVYSKDSFQRPSDKPKQQKQHQQNVVDDDQYEDGDKEENEDYYPTINNSNNLPIHKQNQNANNHNSSMQSHSLPLTPSMVDLRADILSFMAKANSHNTHEYGQYLDTQLSPPPKHAHGNHKSNNSTAMSHNSSSAMIIQRANANANSSASVMSQQSIQSSLPEEHQHLAKLWDQLRNRYAGDREGVHEMKQKIREYIHTGLKEENKITKSYMEEMDDWN